MGERIFANVDDTERQLLFPLSDNKDDERATRRLASISPFPTKRRVFVVPKGGKEGRKKKMDSHLRAREQRIQSKRKRNAPSRRVFRRDNSRAGKG